MTPELGELVRIGLENALNAALAADPDAQVGLRALAGKRLRIEFKGVFSLDVLPQRDHVILAAPGLDAPDATLRASPLGFLRAKMHGNLMHGDIELIGDSHASVRAARLLANLKPDIEVALTPKLGLLLAHQLGRAWHGLSDELKRTLEHHTQNKADFLHDEIDASPRPIEIENLFDALDPLQNRLARLEARIQTLETRSTQDAA